MFIDNLARARGIFSLQISIKEAAVMAHEARPEPNTHLNGNLLDVNKVSCLGPTIPSTSFVDDEIGIRPAEAAATFVQLTKRVWNEEKLTIRTKALMYQSCVPSRLLYGAETWTTHAKHKKIPGETGI